MSDKIISLENLKRYNNGLQSKLIKEISSVEEMDAFAVAENEGRLVKYTGPLGSATANYVPYYYAASSISGFTYEEGESTFHYGWNSYTLSNAGGKCQKFVFKTDSNPVPDLEYTTDYGWETGYYNERNTRLIAGQPYITGIGYVALRVGRIDTGNGYVYRIFFGEYNDTTHNIYISPEYKEYIESQGGVIEQSGWIQEGIDKFNEYWYNNTSSSSLVVYNGHLEEHTIDHVEKLVWMDENNNEVDLSNKGINISSEDAKSVYIGAEIELSVNSELEPTITVVKNRENPTVAITNINKLITSDVNSFIYTAGSLDYGPYWKENTSSIFNDGVKLDWYGLEVSGLSIPKDKITISNIVKYPYERELLLQVIKKGNAIIYNSLQPQEKNDNKFYSWKNNIYLPVPLVPGDNISKLHFNTHLSSTEVNSIIDRMIAEGQTTASLIRTKYITRNVEYTNTLTVSKNSKYGGGYYYQITTTSQSFGNTTVYDTSVSGNPWSSNATEVNLGGYELLEILVPGWNDGSLVSIYTSGSWEPFELQSAGNVIAIGNTILGPGDLPDKKGGHKLLATESRPMRSSAVNAVTLDSSALYINGDRDFNYNDVLNMENLPIFPGSEQDPVYVLFSSSSTPSLFTGNYITLDHGQLLSSMLTLYGLNVTPPGSDALVLSRSGIPMWANKEFVDWYWENATNLLRVGIKNGQIWREGWIPELKNGIENNVNISSFQLIAPDPNNLLKYSFSPDNQWTEESSEVINLGWEDNAIKARDIGSASFTPVDNTYYLHNGPNVVIPTPVDVTQYFDTISFDDSTDISTVRTICQNIANNETPDQDSAGVKIWNLLYDPEAGMGKVLFALKEVNRSTARTIQDLYVLVNPSDPDSNTMVWASEASSTMRVYNSGWQKSTATISNLDPNFRWTAKGQTYWNSIVSPGDPQILYKQGIVYYYNDNTFNPITGGGGGSGHTHANKAVLDNVTQAVVDNSHTHSNKSILDNIDSAKITQWDAAQPNVKPDWNAASGADAEILNKPASLPASDVSAWAKAANKPTYTADEVLPSTSDLDTTKKYMLVVTFSSGSPVFAWEEAPVDGSNVEF